MPLFKPAKMFHRVTDITADYLRSIGVEGLALDADNTLSTHHSQTSLEGVPEWLEMMKNEQIKLIMVSNSKSRRVKPFAEKLGLDYLSLSCKPLPFAFLKAKRKLGLKGRQLAAVGDQLFTDMLGANLAGITPIHVTPIQAENGASFKLRRKLESVLIKGYRNKI